MNPTAQKKSDDSDSSDYPGKEEFKDEQGEDSEGSLEFSDAETIKGTTAKAKLGDIRVFYTVKTCRYATILAQQFQNYKRGTIQFRTFNFKNIDALPEEFTKPTKEMLKEREQCLDF